MIETWINKFAFLKYLNLLVLIFYYIWASTTDIHSKIINWINYLLDEGKLDPSAVFTVDPSTGQITSLATLIQDGKLNPESGKVIEPVSGREMSLSEAIANNFIDPHVDSEKVFEFV